MLACTIAALCLTACNREGEEEPVQACSLPPIELGENQLLEPGATITLSTPEFDGTVTWSTGASTSSIEVSEPGTYSVVASRTCTTATATDSVTITRGYPVGSVTTS